MAHALGRLVVPVLFSALVARVVADTDGDSSPARRAFSMSLVSAPAAGEVSTTLPWGQTAPAYSPQAPAWAPAPAPAWAPTAAPAWGTPQAAAPIGNPYGIQSAAPVYTVAATTVPPTTTEKPNGFIQAAMPLLSGIGGAFGQAKKMVAPAAKKLEKIGQNVGSQAIKMAGPAGQKAAEEIGKGAQQATQQAEKLAAPTAQKLQQQAQQVLNLAGPQTTTSALVLGALWTTTQAPAIPAAAPWTTAAPTEAVSDQVARLRADIAKSQANPLRKAQTTTLAASAIPTPMVTTQAPATQSALEAQTADAKAKLETAQQQKLAVQAQLATVEAKLKKGSATAVETTATPKHAEVATTTLEVLKKPAPPPPPPPPAPPAAAPKKVATTALEVLKKPAGKFSPPPPPPPPPAPPAAAPKKVARTTPAPKSVAKASPQPAGQKKSLRTTPKPPDDLQKVEESHVTANAAQEAAVEAALKTVYVAQAKAKAAAKDTRLFSLETSKRQGGKVPFARGSGGKSILLGCAMLTLAALVAFVVRSVSVRRRSNTSPDVLGSDSEELAIE